MREFGLPEETCQNYEAKDNALPVCSAEQRCMNCAGPPPADRSAKGNCWAVNKHDSWKVSQHGSVRGAEKMKAEIFARGPIACGVDATPKL